MFCSVFKKAVFKKRIAAYEENGSPLDIIRIANEAIKAFPYDFEFYFARGKAWFIKGVDDRAIIDFSKAIVMVPFHQAALIFRATLYRENNEYDKALSDLSAVLEISPDDAVALNERGKIELATAEYEKAIADFSKVLEIEPDDEDDEIYQARSEAYLKLGRIEESKADALKSQSIKKKARLIFPLQPAPEDDDEDYDEDEEIEKLITDASKPRQVGSRISVKKFTSLYYLSALLVIVVGIVLLWKFSMWAVFAFAIIAGGFVGWIGSDLEWNWTARQNLEEDLEKQRAAFVKKGDKRNYNAG
jgi:tetratricopeptide (TPR) repeat protein